MGWSQHHPVGLIYSAPQHCFRGYTLTTNNRGNHARLIDLEGRVCHQWQSDQGIGYAYLPTNLELVFLFMRSAPCFAQFVSLIASYNDQAAFMKRPVLPPYLLR